MADEGNPSNSDLVGEAQQKFKQARHDAGLRLAIFAPHGFDSSRVGDYGLREDLHVALDAMQEAFAELAQQLEQARKALIYAAPYVNGVPPASVQAQRYHQQIVNAALTPDEGADPGGR